MGMRAGVEGTKRSARGMADYHTGCYHGSTVLVKVKVREVWKRLAGQELGGKLESRNQKLEIGKQIQRARNRDRAKLIKTKRLATGSATLANSARVGHIWGVH